MVLNGNLAPGWRMNDVKSSSCNRGRRNAAELRATLARLGVMSMKLEEAANLNSGGPVRMVTTRYSWQVDYQVFIGDDGLGWHSNSLCIWDRSVFFGVATGDDFADATRTQNDVAKAVHELLKALASEHP